MDEGKYLVVKGVAGLGNRIFTLASAIQYAKKNRRTLLVDWEDGYLYPKRENFFFSFFSLNGIPYISNWGEIPPLDPNDCLPPLSREMLEQDIYSNFSPVATFLNQRIPPHRIRFRGRLARIRRYWKNQISDAGPMAACHLSYGSDLSGRVQEKLILFADYCPEFNHNILVEHLSLQPQVEAKLNAYFEEKLANRRSFGLHYRNTDKRPEGELTQWISNIKSWEIQPEVLFLATDDPQVESLLRQHFPDIVTFPKVFPPDSKHNLHHFGMKHNDISFAHQAMEASVMDMWLLSRCDYLFYQENSTFSKVSQIYHRNPQRCFDWQSFSPGL